MCRFSAGAKLHAFMSVLRFSYFKYQFYYHSHGIKRMHNTTLVLNCLFQKLLGALQKLRLSRRVMKEDRRKGGVKKHFGLVAEAVFLSWRLTVTFFC